MTGELSFDNILTGNEISDLFSEDNSTEETQVNPPEEKDNTKENNEETTEVDVDDLFSTPEGVGGEEDKQDKEDTTSKKNGTSPDNNFYSSIAKALKNDGIFPDLDDDSLNAANTPDDFANLIEAQIQAKFDERYKRVDDLLNLGVEPSEIQRYENTIGYLDNLKDDDISDESEKGETLRKNLIYQDFINRGYSKERASREVQKSFNAGSDIEDAKEALQSNKDFFNGKYNDLLKSAKEEEEKYKEEQRKQGELLKKSILEDKETFAELNVDKATRQKIYDNISKPVYKDPDTGDYLTAIQKYEKENSNEFLKNIGLIYTLTDGFKNLDGLVKTKVNKKVREGLSNLEKTLNTTSRNSDGSLKYVRGVGDDNQSYIGRGWNLA